MISFLTAVLQKTWDTSCGAVFGLGGPKNQANLNRLQQKLVEFVNDPGTKIIPSVYSAGSHQRVMHFVNPTAGLHVMRSETGELIGARVPGPTALPRLLETGAVGNR